MPWGRAFFGYWPGRWLPAGVDERIGGANAVIFLLQRSPDKFRQGLIGGSVIGMGTPYVETNQLGVTNSEAVRRDGIAICGFGSAKWSRSYSARELNSVPYVTPQKRACSTRYRCPATI